MNVLISAYSCGPGRGSEPGVGWNWACQIARNHEAWVLTTCEFKSDIEKQLQNSPFSNLHFCFFDTPLRNFFWRFGENGLRLHYIFWQLFALLIGYRLHRLHHFDLAHHITFAVDWMPSFISLLPIPFVWGPIGGSVRHLQLNFWREFNIRPIIYECIRYLYQFFGFHLAPFVQFTKKKAKIIIVGAERTKYDYSSKYYQKIRVMSNIGISVGEIPHFKKPKRNQEFTIFTSGRLVHWKGYVLALKAFGIFLKNFPNAMFIIGGKGPEQKRLEKIAKRMKILGNVIFTGYLSTRAEVFEQLHLCDVCIIPSLRDGPLVSVLEAMIMGKPVVCLDAGGQSELITEECGIKVKPVTPEQTINDLADALLKLVNDPNLRKKMGEVGRRRVLEEYNWDKKGEFIKKVYEEVLRDRK